MTTKHINLRLDPELHSWLSGRAARESRSINGHIEHLLKQDRLRDPRGGDRRTVLVGDTYVTPEEAAQYAEEEAVADEVFGRRDADAMRAIEREYEAATETTGEPS